ILRAHVPGVKIWVFGSRAKGTTRRGSDLDLAISAVPPAAKARLAEAFENAPLAYKVDIVDLATVSPEFRALIDAHKIALPGFE
ncbi:MAG: nucleotidyltransferase domain-containing protein, partial [Rhodospirillales bacterium]|nr:nucleotidyltransferase domain-containing protein [Rhodospirillales bacterium]